MIHLPNKSMDTRACQTGQVDCIEASAEAATVLQTKVEAQRAKVAELEDQLEHFGENVERLKNGEAAGCAAKASRWLIKGIEVCLHHLSFVDALRWPSQA